jgi:hypothetical protein
LPHPSKRFALAVVLIAILFTASAVAARILRTERTTRLALFDSSGQLAAGYRVAAEHKGSCFTSSLAVDGTDAWRCTAGNEILDPCFQPPRGDGPLVCLADPWSREVTRLRLTRALPKATPVDAGKPMPWAVETSGDLRCTKLTGATDEIDGQRVSYGCTDHSVLVGDVDDGSDQWTILRSPTADPRRPELDRVSLRRAFSP